MAWSWPQPPPYPLPVLPMLSGSRGCRDFLRVYRTRFVGLQESYCHDEATQWATVWPRSPLHTSIRPHRLWRWWSSFLARARECAWAFTDKLRCSGLLDLLEAIAITLRGTAGTDYGLLRQTFTGKSWGRTNSSGRTTRLIGAHDSVLRFVWGSHQNLSTCSYPTIVAIGDRHLPHIDVFNLYLYPFYILVAVTLLPP